MDVIIVNDNLEGCTLGAKIISDVVKTKNNAVLGLATGKTPIPLYGELVKKHKEEGWILLMLRALILMSITMCLLQKKVLIIIL